MEVLVGARNAGDVRLGRGAFIGYLVLSLALGLVIGVGLLIWQRTVLLRDIASLEKRLSDQKAAAGDAESRATAAESELASATLLVSQLTSRTAELSRLLDEATSALAAERAKSATTGVLTLNERSISPNPVKAGKPMTLTVKLTGKATKVRMRVVFRTNAATYDKYFYLHKASTSGTTETWHASATAPSTLGEYKFYATGYVGTKKYEMAGVSAWSLQVE
jgi:hypothetical protein